MREQVRREWKGYFQRTHKRKVWTMHIYSNDGVIGYYVHIRFGGKPSYKYYTV